MIIYTNAPRSYDYPQNTEVSAGGYRTIDCPDETASFQIGRYQSGLYWVTQAKEDAEHLSSFQPWIDS